MKYIVEINFIVVSLFLFSLCGSESKIIPSETNSLPTTTSTHSQPSEYYDCNFFSNKGYPCKNVIHLLNDCYGIIAPGYLYYVTLSEPFPVTNNTTIPTDSIIVLAVDGPAENPHIRNVDCLYYLPSQNIQITNSIYQRADEYLRIVEEEGNTVYSITLANNTEVNGLSLYAGDSIEYYFETGMLSGFKAGSRCHSSLTHTNDRSNHFSVNAAITCDISNWIWFHKSDQSNLLSSCTLVQDAIIQGYTIASGVNVYLDESGTLSKIYQPANTPFLGFTYGETIDGSDTYVIKFHTIEGQLVWHINLPFDITIMNIDIPARSHVFLFNDGTIQGILLSQDTIISGIPCKAYEEGKPVRFEDGRIKSAYLSQDYIYEGTSYSTGDYIEFAE